MRTLTICLMAIFLCLLMSGGCSDSSTGTNPDGSVNGQTPDTGTDTTEPDTTQPDVAPDGADEDIGGPDGAGDGVLPDATPDAAPVFGCVSVSPPAGSNTADVIVMVDGQLFEADATIEMTDLVTDQALTLGETTVTDTDGDGSFDRAEVVVPAATPQGTYAVTINNPTSAEAASCGTYVSTTAVAPMVTDVSPDTAWEGDPTDTLLSDQPVTIKGSGFFPTPSVRFVNVATKQVFTALAVSYINAGSLTAVCPSESEEMPVGDYHVEVMNPNLLTGVWTVAGQPGIFRVTPTPPPIIDDVSPFKVAANVGGGSPAPTITVTGENFDADAKLLLLLPDGTTFEMPTITVTPDPSAPDTITFVFDNASVIQQPVGIYPLRVINPDGQFDTYFSMQIENSAPGKLNADDWKTLSALNVARERLGVVEGFDAFGSSFVYAVGGTSVPDGGDLDARPRPVLSSGEVIQISVFGDPQGEARMLTQLDSSIDPAQIDPKHDALRSDNLLDTARSGLALVRAGRFLYAIGGVDSDSWDPAAAGTVAALDTVERARILGYETMPNLSLPQVAPASKGLPRGSWYYRVSAVVDGEGESLASREVVAQNAEGVITLKWMAVPGASSYLVYRNLAADGRAGTTRLLATGVTGTTFTDDGQGELAPAPGRLGGSIQAGGALGIGVWTYRVAAIPPNSSETLAGYAVDIEITAAGSQTVGLAWDPIPGATYNVYRSDAAGGDETFQLASGLTTNSYTDDGSVDVDTDKPAPEGTSVLPAGSLSYWSTLQQKLVSPREGSDAVVIKAVDGVDATTDEPSYIFVVGGRSDNALGVDYLRTTERSQVDPQTGALGAFSVVQADGGGDLQLVEPRAFFGLVKTQGRNITPAAPPPEAPPCPDNDADGHTACSCGGDDCNDADSSIYPGAAEICGDGIDQDCDQGCAGGADLACAECTTPDGDGDGYDRPECGGDDCNDGDPTICPSATKCPEICGDGIDQDCDGKDEPCDCTDPDVDGDGFDRPGCGGDDCDDSDPTICPDPDKCPEVNCDGIDQDCDGADMCVLYTPHDTKKLGVGEQSNSGVCVHVSEQYELRRGASLMFSTPYFPPSVDLFAVMEPEEPVLLAALFGDSSYVENGKNNGLKSAEVALVRTDGTLSAWVLQKPESNVAVYGNDAMLYGDFAFSIQGVINETLGVDPASTAIWNNAWRFEIDPDAIVDWTEPVSDSVFTKGQPADAPMVQGRCYLGATRLNGYIFGLGGNGGEGVGPLAGGERIKQ